MTMTAAATKMGVIMGTAAYMSPEQARAGTADRRSDIWAFGVVLLEMLTGQAPFTGKTVSDTLALVLTKEPDWTTLPANTPGPIRRLLRRCLEKEPKQRLGFIGDARLDIDDAKTGPDGETPAVASIAQHALWQRPVPATAALVLALALGGLSVWMLTGFVPPRVVRFPIPLAANQTFRFDSTLGGGGLPGRLTDRLRSQRQSLAAPHRSVAG